MTQMTQEEMMKYDQMLEWEIATGEELNLARNLVDGSWNDILDAVCYVRTGYKTWEDFIENEMEEED